MSKTLYKRLHCLCFSKTFSTSPLKVNGIAVSLIFIRNHLYLDKLTYYLNTQYLFLIDMSNIGRLHLYQCARVSEKNEQTVFSFSNTSLIAAYGHNYRTITFLHLHYIMTVTHSNGRYILYNRALNRIIVTEQIDQSDR